MGLVTPKLDDRQFQEIVDEAKSRIPHFCKEWTDHNVSDPGITLIELFAWMTDLLLYRLNQVPDLHYIKFLELLGIKLRETVPARVPVTFWLSAPQTNPVLIPVGTEVASTQTETERSIVFSTDEDLRVQPPELVEVLARVSSSKSGKKRFRELNLRRLETGFEGIDVFTDVPEVDDALYFGFSNDLSRHILGFKFDFDPAGGAGIDPTLPPYQWEATTGLEDGHWKPCDVETDTTRGMNSTGKIHIHLPKMGKYTVNNKTHYWVRVRIKEISQSEEQDGMRPYDKSPKLRQLSAASWGGTISSTHAQLIQRELLGSSDGTPGQRFQTQFTPILKRNPDETITVISENEPPQEWVEEPDFAESEINSRHYTLDSVTGELRFGPAVRQQDGTIKLYGAIPQKGSKLVLQRYRYGGGEIGNVQTGILNTLKTAIPYIARVTNRDPAWGGLDAEPLESAKMRAPALLRSRDRAVTEEDFEFLARQAIPAEIGRVKCLQPRPAEAGRVVPGQVYVLVIPRLSHPKGFILPEQLKPKEEVIDGLTAFLDERRLLTTRLDIRPPAYHWVSINVELSAAPSVEPSKLEQEVLARLYQFLNPLTGGSGGEGWPFGRDLFVSDVYQCLQGIPGVLFIRNVDLHQAKPGAEAQGEVVEVVEVVAHGVIASGQHSVKFI